jgi:hypothetical protein
VCSDRINFYILDILFSINIQNKTILTKFLAIFGTLLVWFPIQAPLLLSAVRIIQTGTSQLDYLMPAELYLFALAGGVLLIWAAWRADAQRKIIFWSLGIAAAALAGAALLATVTGLTTSPAEPGGVWWLLTALLLAVYSLALVIAGVGGVLLLLNLFRPAS